MNAIESEDDPGNLGTQTSKLLGGGAAQKVAGSGSRGGPPAPRDFGAGYRALGLASGEGANQTQVQTPQGRAGHGADIPAEGIATPEAAAPEAGAGIGADLADVAEEALPLIAG